MIKFALVSIIVILMILGIYTYSNRASEKSSPTPPVSVKKKESTKTKKVSVVAQEVKKKKSSVKNITVKSPKVVLQEPTQDLEIEEEIGKSLTLESIENSNVSDEEKEIMRSDMAYYQSLNAEPSEPLTHEEIVKMVEDDIKNGLIQ